MKLAALILLASAPAFARDDSGAILRAIALVESGGSRHAVGDGGRAVGAWQMHPEAWQDANDFRRAQGLPGIPRSRWREGWAQEAMAKAFYSLIRARLARAGVINPTASQIALCWNVGFAGAKSRDFRPTDYSTRVARLAGDNRK